MTLRKVACYCDGNINKRMAHWSWKIGDGPIVRRVDRRRGRSGQDIEELAMKELFSALADEMPCHFIVKTDNKGVAEKMASKYKTVGKSKVTIQYIPGNMMRNILPHENFLILRLMFNRKFRSKNGKKLSNNNGR